MKKYVLSLVMALAIMLVPMKVKGVELPEVTDHEKVTVYLFYQSTCSHCHAFIEYFADIYLDYEDYFEIVTYQLDGDNSYNGTLYVAVAEALDEEAGYVPLIVVGDTYHAFGFGDDGTEVIEAALEAYQDEDYVDLVADILEEEEITDADAGSFLDACEIVDVTCSGTGGTVEESGLSDGVVIAIIFGVIIVVFGGLIVLSRRKEK